MKIDIYGSFATDLSIENSDIDMLIRILDQKESTFESMCFQIVDDIKNLKIYDEVVPIFTASVPIIKLVMKIKSDS